MKRTKKVLVVEDEAIIALDIELKLQSWGYTTCNHINSFKKASETIQFFRPDLIILDINLKDGPTGFNIAELANDKNIPFIFVTASVNESYYSKAKSYQPVSIIHKPLVDNELKYAIESLN